MLRFAAAAIVDVAVPNDDVEILSESGRKNSQTNQRTLHGAIEKASANDVDPKSLFLDRAADLAQMLPKRVIRVAGTFFYIIGKF